MEIKQFKIRCSAIGQIMAGKIGLTDIQKNELIQFEEKIKLGRLLTVVQDVKYKNLLLKNNNTELPETCKTYCKDWLKGQIYNRQKEFSNKFTEKGLIVEDQSLDFIAKMLDLGMIIKNEAHFENDFMNGTPDAILPEMVIDVKNSWDCFTFPLFDTEIENSSYFYQLQGYMHLTGKKKAKLIYCITDTPENLIERECKFWCLKNGYEMDIDIYNQFFNKMTYSDIEDHFKIKIFDIEYDENVINSIFERVLLCRDYIQILIKQIQ